MGWFPNVPGLLLQVKNKAKEGGIRDCESRTEAWDSGTQNTAWSQLLIYITQTNLKIIMLIERSQDLQD